jgi:hypothetical protein
MGHPDTAVFGTLHAAHAATDVARRALESARAPSHDDSDLETCGELPCSLTGILEPDAALAAARRLQRWYQSTPQGAAHSLFGRDGRRVEGRPLVEFGSDLDD